MCAWDSPLGAPRYSGKSIIVPFTVVLQLRRIYSILATCPIFFIPCITLLRSNFIVCNLDIVQNTIYHGEIEIKAEIVRMEECVRMTGCSLSRVL